MDRENVTNTKVSLGDSSNLNSKLSIESHKYF